MAPVIENVAGEPSLAEALAGVTAPETQERETVTLAALLGTKSLRTSNVSVVCVLVIVHWPALRSAEHVPVEE